MMDERQEQQEESAAATSATLQEIAPEENEKPVAP